MGTRICKKRIYTQSPAHVSCLHLDFHPTRTLGAWRGFFPTPPPRRRPCVQHLIVAMGRRDADQRQDLPCPRLQHRKVHRWSPLLRAKPTGIRGRSPRQPPHPDIGIMSISGTWARDVWSALLLTEDDLNPGFLLNAGLTPTHSATLLTHGDRSPLIVSSRVDTFTTGVAQDVLTRYRTKLGAVTDPFEGAAWIPRCWTGPWPSPADCDALCPRWPGARGAGSARMPP